MKQMTSGTIVRVLGLVLLAVFFLAGCAEKNDFGVNAPSSVQAVGAKSLARVRTFDNLRSLMLPAAAEPRKNEGDVRLVLPNKDADLKAKLHYRTLDSKGLKLEATVHIDKGCLAAPSLVSVSFDPETGALEIMLPEGGQFLVPPTVDWRGENLAEFADNSPLYFVRNNGDGTYDSKFCGSLTQRGNSGWFEVKEGVIDQPGEYLLGSVVDLIGIPDVATPLKYEADEQLVSPNQDVKLEATYQYLATNGRRVELKAKMIIRKESLNGPTVISMAFDRENGQIVFEPEGLKFNSPAILEVSEDHLAPFPSGKEVVFVYLDPNGACERQVYSSLVADGSKGTIHLAGAEINHFSRYCFGY